MRVVPLVLEHFGRWGKKAETYLDDLSKQSKDDFGKSNRAEFKDQLASKNCHSIAMLQCQCTSEENQ